MYKHLNIVALLATVFFLGSAFTTNPEGEPTKTKKEVVVQEINWTNNLAEAHELSLKTGKPIMAFFTGSDWCGWCKKLQREVFKKEAFISWANENVIPLELDFPRRTQLPADISQQNRQLQQIFQVRGYPTVWFFTTEMTNEGKNMQMNKLGQSGYPRGATVGKEEVKFIETANNILAKSES